MNVTSAGQLKPAVRGSLQELRRRERGSESDDTSTWEEVRERILGRGSNAT